MTRYLIISTSRNAAPWLAGSLGSIGAQAPAAGDTFDVCVIDDASDDESPDVIEAFARKNGWTYRLNTERLGALRNQCEAIDMLNPAPDDVIVFVDGDDRLAHPQVLAHLHEYYWDPEVLLTYGSYRPVPASATCPMPQPYPPDVIKRRTFRTQINRIGIPYNHLRTFRAGPFLALDRDVRCKWPDGTWFSACPDGALMLPILESVGHRHRFIREVLYEYNSANDDSEWRVRPREIDRTYQYVASLPPVPWYEHDA